MRLLLTFLLAVSVGVLPVRSDAQEDEEEDDGNDSFEQSTEDSSDETTAESTNQPSRNTTDPTVELLGPLLDGGAKPTESEGDYTDKDRAAALGIASLSIALVIVAIVSVAAGGNDARPADPSMAPHEQRAAAWLSENDEQIRIDIARGEGPTLDDLAAAFMLAPERKPAFSRAIRDRRDVLLAALDESPAVPERRIQRVRTFLREVGATLREDEALRPDWVRWRMTYGIASPP